MHLSNPGPVNRYRFSGGKHAVVADACSYALADPRVLRGVGVRHVIGITVSPRIPESCLVPGFTAICASSYRVLNNSTADTRRLIAVTHLIRTSYFPVALRRSY